MSNSKMNLKAVPNPKGTQTRPAPLTPTVPRSPNGRFTPPFRPAPKPHNPLVAGR
jgi:hypothetical protein